MARKHQLRRSGERLQTQSLLLFQQTRNAGNEFIAETRGAGVEFAEDLAAATKKLAGRTTDSAGTFGSAVRQEALTWGQLLTQAPSAYASELERRRQTFRRSTVELATNLRPDRAETVVLQAVRDVLVMMQKRIDTRLSEEVEPTAKRAPVRRSAVAKAAQADRTGRAPLRNYDQLTARDVVSRLQRLSGPRATEVLAYEKAGKNRTTVIRAAKQRAMAS